MSIATLGAHISEVKDHFSRASDRVSSHVSQTFYGESASRHVKLAAKGLVVASAVAAIAAAVFAHQFIVVSAVATKVTFAVSAALSVGSLLALIAHIFQEKRAGEKEKKSIDELKLKFTSSENDLKKKTEEAKKLEENLRASNISLESAEKGLKDLQGKVDKSKKEAQVNAVKLGGSNGAASAASTAATAAVTPDHLTLLQKIHDGVLRLEEKLHRPHHRDSDKSKKVKDAVEGALN